MTEPLKPTNPNCMDQQWCCLTCSGTFRFGRIIAGRADETHPYGLYCPLCRSADMHPADGGEMVLGEYHGERGTVQ